MLRLVVSRTELVMIVNKTAMPVRTWRSGSKFLASFVRRLYTYSSTQAKFVTDDCRKLMQRAWRGRGNTNIRKSSACKNKACRLTTKNYSPFIGLSIDLIESSPCFAMSIMNDSTSLQNSTQRVSSKKRYKRFPQLHQFRDISVLHSAAHIAPLPVNLWPECWEEHSAQWFDCHTSCIFSSVNSHSEGTFSALECFYRSTRLPSSYYLVHLLVN